jgi:cysteine synthase
VAAVELCRLAAGELGEPVEPVELEELLAVEERAALAVEERLVAELGVVVGRTAGAAEPPVGAEEQREAAAPEVAAAGPVEMAGAP